MTKKLIERLKTLYDDAETAFISDPEIIECFNKLKSMKENAEQNILPTLPEVTQSLNQLKSIKKNIDHKILATEKNNIDLKFISYLENTISKLEEAHAIITTHEQINNEIKDVERGWYQKQVRHFSEAYGNKRVLPYSCEDDYLVIPVMNEPGLRCTAAIPAKPNSNPIEIQLNFLGTVDFSSKYADMDEGGPGQETIKQHEQKLMEQVNIIIEQMSEKYPDQTFRLRLAGHSLGGALAKGFAHSIQRACAIQKDTADEIIRKIETEIEFAKSDNLNITRESLDSLQKKLGDDVDKFRNFNALNKIQGAAIYALGSPGVSETTDKHGTLLTYYHQADFLRMYNHFHTEDIMVKFGDTEFLSGNNGVPRILANKVIEFDIAITPQDEELAGTLPFPGVTKHVMAAHNKMIYQSSEKVSSRILELRESKHIMDKYIFNPLYRAIYAAAFSFAKYLSSFEEVVNAIPDLQTLPTYTIGKPVISGNQDIFSEEYKNIEKAKKSMACGEILLQGLSDKEKYISTNEICAEINEALLKRAECKRLCEAYNEMEVFEGLAYPPKNRQVFDAYNAYVTAASKISYNDILTIANNYSKELAGQMLLKALKPLCIAASTNDIDTVITLLNYGVDINEPSKSNGMTALYHAAIKGHLDTVKVLLERGASIDNNTEAHLSLMKSVMRFRNPELFTVMFDVLVKQQTIINPKFWQQLLMPAIENMMPLDVVKDLVNKGGKINITDIENITPLQLAVVMNRTDIVNTYIDDHMEMINTPIYNKKYPLHYAAELSHEMLSLLLQHGANMNTINAEGLTPIQITVQNSSPAILAIFEKNYPDCLHQVDNNGHSLLYYAVKNPDNRMLNVLLEKGLKYQDTKELQSLFFAENHGSTIGKTLLHALLTAGGDINMLDENGNTALHVAVQRMNYDKVQFLLENGANVASVNKDGNTALHLTAKNGGNLTFASYNIEHMINLLICSGADLYAKNNNGETPKEFAQNLSKNAINNATYTLRNAETIPEINFYLMNPWIMLIKESLLSDKINEKQAETLQTILDEILNATKIAYGIHIKEEWLEQIKTLSPLAENFAKAREEVRKRKIELYSSISPSMLQKKLEADWKHQRLIFIDKVQSEIKKNKDMFGRTKNNDKNTVLTSLMNILLYNNTELRHENAFNTLLNKFPEFYSLNQKIVEHINQNSKIIDHSISPAYKRI